MKMEKCKWYGCLAGSGPQTQWLASTRRQWVTLLILDRRQVGAGVWSDGEAEVIVCNLCEIKCCDQKRNERNYILPLSLFFFIGRCHAEGDTTTKGQLKENRGKQCQHPKRMAQNGSSLRYIVHKKEKKVWRLNKRVGGKNTHLHANTKVVPCH